MEEGPPIVVEAALLEPAVGPLPGEDELEIAERGLAVARVAGDERGVQQPPGRPRVVDVDALPGEARAVSAPRAVRIHRFHQEVRGAAGRLLKARIARLTIGGGPSEEDLAGVEYRGRGGMADDSALDGPRFHLHVDLPPGHPQGALAEVVPSDDCRIGQEGRNDVPGRLRIGGEPPAALMPPHVAEGVAAGDASAARRVLRPAQPFDRRVEVLVGRPERMPDRQGIPDDETYQAHWMDAP